MNQWLKLTVMLRETLPDLPSPSPLRETMSPAQLAARELVIAENLDAAIHSFSTSGRWPLLDHEEGFFITERIHYALNISRALETPDPRVAENSIFPSPPEAFPVEDQLQWILIASWNHSGRETWGFR